MSKKSQFHLSTLLLTSIFPKCPAIMHVMVQTHSARRWFQLHLSTCVALMFVAGILIWSNATPKHSKLKDYPRKGQEPPFDIEVKRYGWPMSAEIEEANGDLTATVYFGDAMMMTSVWIVFGWNAIVALPILGLTAASFEYAVRRRVRDRRA